MKPQPKQKPKNNRANSANIISVIGASGAGKTSYVMREVAKSKPKRVLIWDTKGEFADEGHAQRVESLTDLIRLTKGKAAFRLALVPYGAGRDLIKLFDLFTQLAFHLGNLTLICEELSDVCRGGSCSAAGWRKAITQGRSAGLFIYALSQRPTLMDKDTLANSSTVRCGRLGWKTDAKMLAPVMWCEESDLINLLPLEFVEYEAKTRHVKRGILKFPSMKDEIYPAKTEEKARV